MLYLVEKIEEDVNFGCEERKADDPVKAVVHIVSEDGMKVMINMEDALLVKREINEGDWVYLDDKQELQKAINS